MTDFNFSKGIIGKTAAFITMTAAKFISNYEMQNLINKPLLTFSG